jgi:hypothetical protein
VTQGIFQTRPARQATMSRRPASSNVMSPPKMNKNDKKNDKNEEKSKKDPKEINKGTGDYGYSTVGTRTGHNRQKKQQMGLERKRTEGQK